MHVSRTVSIEWRSRSHKRVKDAFSHRLLPYLLRHMYASLQVSPKKKRCPPELDDANTLTPKKLRTALVHFLIHNIVVHLLDNLEI